MFSLLSSVVLPKISTTNVCTGKTGLINNTQLPSLDESIMVMVVEPATQFVTEVDLFFSPCHRGKDFNTSGCPNERFPHRCDPLAV